jgi:hypothetical protein
VCSRFKRAWARQFGKRARLVSIRRPESLDRLPRSNPNSAIGDYAPAAVPALLQHHRCSFVINQ